MYCNLDDIKRQLPEDILIQVTDDDGLGQVDQDKVDEAIDNAAAVIDGYCSAKYVIPFAVVPALLKPIAVDLAIYDLYARRDKVPESREAKQKNAIKLLTDISTGKIRLGAEAVTAAVQPQQSPSVTGNGRLFGRDRMKGL